LSCVTVNVRPAIVMVPVRRLPELAVTLNATLPVPVPLCPEVTAIHAAWLVAVHAHPAVVVTTTVGPAPAPEPDDALVGVIAYTQVPAAWFTLKGCPAIVSIPERAGPAFAATVKPTVPLPLPVAPDVTVIQVTWLVTLHAQPAVAVTAIAGPVPRRHPTTRWSA
jgi:hypothetical protein